MPKVSHKEFNFDADLKFGESFEDEIINLFEGDGSVEVKADDGIWKRTGNIVVEIRYKGKPSGISTTDAKWWINCLIDNNVMVGALMFKTSTLKRIIKNMVKSKTAQIIKGGDDNNSGLVKMPISELWKHYTPDHPLLEYAKKKLNCVEF